MKTSSSWAGESGIGYYCLKECYDVFVSDKGIITEKSVLQIMELDGKKEFIQKKKSYLSEVIKSPGIPDSKDNSRFG